MIDEWSEIHKISKQGSNYALAKKYGAINSLIALLVLYLVICSICYFLFYNNYYLASIVIMFANFLLMEFSLTEVFYRLANVTEFKNFNRRQKRLYFGYFQFKEKFNENEKLSLDKIDSILEWKRIEVQKVEKSNFFETKIFSTPMTMLLGMLLGYSAKNSNQHELLLVVFMIVSLVFIVWNIFDAFMIGKKNQFVTMQFLEWLQLEEIEKNRKNKRG